MEQRQSVVENKRFGRYLRQVREERKLSLDTVEEMTVGYPDRVTKSHLSRIENGQATPSFQKMFALSQIYGVPIAALAERFEIDLRRDMHPVEVDGQRLEETLASAAELRRGGRYAEALLHYDALLERNGEPTPDATEKVELRLLRVGCLVHLARYLIAKEECEDLLNAKSLENRQRVVALHYLTMCCYRLGKLSVALMALRTTHDAAANLAESDPLRAQLCLLEGNVLAVTGRAEEAVGAYTQALRRFETAGDAFEACRTRLNLAAALIEWDRAREAQKQLLLALEDARRGGYDRQQALALGTLGLLAFRRDEVEAAENYLLQSNALARPREYFSVVFRNCYYLWRIALGRDDLAGAKSNERTLRTYVGRVEPFLPEVMAFRDELAGGKR